MVALLTTEDKPGFAASLASGRLHLLHACVHVFCSTMDRQRGGHVSLMKGEARKGRKGLGMPGKASRRQSYAKQREKHGIVSVTKRHIMSLNKSLGEMGN